MTINTIPFDEFIRKFSLRAKNLMWLIGAGTSAYAGIPTAIDMIWDFKQQLYASQRHVPRHVVENLSSPAIRSQLQSHIDSLGKLPPAGTPGEYAALFEAVYPDERDRRAYIESKIRGAKPSYGHLALATLMRAELLRVIWTTNFDPLIADGCAKVFGDTGSLTTITLDAPDLASTSLIEGRWPIEVKLHGDFRSRHLKNTNDELRRQDAQIRQHLIDFCHRYGLIVTGYSGRDESVMESLEEAMTTGTPYPAGLFWLQRGEDDPSDRVLRLLSTARDKGIESALVRIENFDELMLDLIRVIQGLDSSQLEIFGTERRRWTAAPNPTGKKGWPIIRLNALAINSFPTVCRRVVCNIGGYADVRKAVEKAEVDIIFARKKVGVLAFGTDSDIRRTFSIYEIDEFDLHPIDKRRLRYDSGERGLLREALTRALVRCHKLQSVRRGITDLLAPTNSSDKEWNNLRRLTGSIEGTVKNFPDLHWQEGVSVRLDWANDRLWLLIEPRLVFNGIDDTNRAAATDFARERTVKRYNRQLNELLNFWASTLAGAELRTFGIGDGVDAVFELSDTSAFSRRTGA